MAATSQVLLLRARPAGLVTADNFLLAQLPVPAQLDQDQVLVKVECAAVGRNTLAAMQDPQQRLGDVLPAYAVGTVVRSGSPRFKQGEYVLGFMGLQECAVMFERELTKLPAGCTPAEYLTAYGLEALTAYFALTKFAKVTPGSLVAVSGASGALGSAAVQIAKHLGAQVLCFPSSDASTAYLSSLHVDFCLPRASPDLASAIRAKTGKDIDVFIDTTGGPVLNAVVRNMKTFGRVVLCGSLRDAGIVEPFVQVAECVMWNITLDGFDVRRFKDEFAAARNALKAIPGYSLRSEQIHGLEHVPAALRKVAKGEARGKVLVYPGAQPRL